MHVQVAQRDIQNTIPFDKKNYDHRENLAKCVYHEHHI